MGNRVERHFNLKGVWVRENLQLVSIVEVIHYYSMLIKFKCVVIMRFHP